MNLDDLKLLEIASKEGIIAAKLIRGSYTDFRDIKSILYKNNNQIDLSGWPLTQEQFQKIEEIKQSPAHEPPLEEYF